jgi:hypothetical protein
LIPKKQHREDNSISDDNLYSEELRDLTSHGTRPSQKKTRRFFRARNVIMAWFILVIVAFPVIWKSSVGGQIGVPSHLKPYVHKWYEFFQEKKDVDAKNDLGVTALMRASLVGRTAEVVELVNKGANVNARDKDGETALMAASFSGFPEIVQILIDTGAEINAKSRNGNSALSLAKQYSQYEVVSLLRRHGAVF